MLAVRFDWTESQIDALDPDYVEELVSYIRAEHDHEAHAAEQARTKHGRGG